jgi:hypothetical protein
MELQTDTEKLSFLLEAEAELADFLADGELSAEAADLPDEASAKSGRPKYITNYIGSKQKLVDWIWANTPDGVQNVADLFSGSAVVGYMYKSKGLAVVSNDRLRYYLPHQREARRGVARDGAPLHLRARIRRFLALRRGASWPQTRFGEIMVTWVRGQVNGCFAK